MKTNDRKTVVTLTEFDLARIVRRVIKEQLDMSWFEIDGRKFKFTDYTIVDFDDKLAQKISNRLKGDWSMTKSNKNIIVENFLQLESPNEMLDLAIFQIEGDRFLVSSFYYDEEDNYEYENFYKCNSDAGLLDLLEHLGVIN